MRKVFLLVAGVLSTLTVMGGGGYPPRGLTFWFDTPNTLQGKMTWYNGYSELWKGENKPESAGARKTLDSDWETRSIPIGNGSLGANILGSVEAERLTFNEKTLWRGGPNTSKGADYRRRKKWKNQRH